MSNIKIGIIGGSGVGQAIAQNTGEHLDIETPFGSPSAPILKTTLEDADTEIYIIPRHGEGHVHPPSNVPYQANIYALKSLGVTHIIATGATGSLREELKPRDIVIPDQVIDKTYRRANTFYPKAAVHCEFSQPFCPVMRKWLLNATEQLDGVDIHDSATYVCMEGPSFSTKAESEMHRLWGGDLIGMTCMPEARLAREAEIAYGLIALPTDYDCWKPHEEGMTQQQLLEEIIGHVNHATGNAINLIKIALTDLSLLERNPSPAHEALKLAIWSDKSKIDPEEVVRLEVLWGKYF